ncbi:MAG: tol-pal system protein YbgF [Proteobacteria bacterium]|nr:tol-pal system protein YbgF [Pseudomonadota bacterium]
MRVGFPKIGGTLMGVRRFVGLIALAMAAATFLPTPASSQDTTQSLVNRLDRMERELRTLNRQVYTGTTPRPTAGATALTPTTPGTNPVGGAENLAGTAYAARMASRMGQMESDLRAMTGTLETITHSLDQVTGRLDKLVADVDARLSALERGTQFGGQPAPSDTALGTASRTPTGPGISAAPNAVGVERVGPTTGGPVFGTAPRTLGTISGRDIKGTGSQTGAAPTPPPAQSAGLAPASQQPLVPQTGLPKGTPLEQYDFAYKLLVQAEYDKAAAAFQAFMEAHPKSPLVSNARFWLGRTYFVRDDFASAAKIFLDNYRTLPNGAKAPDSLASLGMSLVKLDKRKDACTTFNKFLAEFPNASKSLKTRVARERKQAECGA